LKITLQLGGDTPKRGRYMKMIVCSTGMQGDATVNHRYIQRSMIPKYCVSRVIFMKGFV
jgi:hypothetical protein